MDGPVPARVPDAVISEIRSRERGGLVELPKLRLEPGARVRVLQGPRDEGKYLEAYSLLQPVYGWFVEGFDTASLKDAKALLDELRNLSGPQTQARRG
jgi:hypothetical protein